MFAGDDNLTTDNVLHLIENFNNNRHIYVPAFRGPFRCSKVHIINRLTNLDICSKRLRAKNDTSYGVQRAHHWGEKISRTNLNECASISVSVDGSTPMIVGI